MGGAALPELGAGGVETSLTLSLPGERVAASVPTEAAEEEAEKVENGGEGEDEGGDQREGWDDCEETHGGGVAQVSTKVVDLDLCEAGMLQRTGDMGASE